MVNHGNHEIKIEITIEIIDFREITVISKSRTPFEKVVDPPVVVTVTALPSINR